MNGWSGPERIVLEKLERLGADRGDDGRFIISGSPARYTLKNGVLHVAIPVDAVFFVRGQRRSFATILDGVASVNPLLSKAANILGPLTPVQKKAVMDYIDAPTEAGWERIYPMIISPGSMRRSTIWQWVLVVDPSFPTSKKGGRWPRIPDPMTVARAIKEAGNQDARAGNPRERPRGECAGASYDASIRLRKVGRMPPELRDRVHDAVRAQPEIACVTSEMPDGRRIELRMKLTAAHEQHGLVALQRALARATAAVSRDLEVTDLGHAASLEIDRRWIVVSDEDGEETVTPFVTYAQDALDGVGGDDTRRVLAMMHAQGFPMVSPARVRMGSCGGRMQTVEVHRSRKDRKAAGRTTDNPRRDHRHKPPESAAQLEKLQERIAQKLGWSIEDVQSMSLRSLREVVRPVSPKLADELTTFIRQGVLLNPTATTPEMMRAVELWLAMEDMSYGVKLKTLDEWHELGWDQEWGLPRRTEGFVIIAEGTSFNHALAGWMDHDRGEEKKIVKSWNALLDSQGWTWEAMTGWAFHVLPRKVQTQAPPASAPPATRKRRARA